MSLKEKIKDDIKQAMRAKNESRLGTLRMLSAAIQRREVDERIQLDDTQVIAVMATDVDTVGTLQNWQIVGGTGATAFAINPATGQITLLEAVQLDYFTTRQFTLLVTVSDGAHTSAVETVTVDIQAVLGPLLPPYGSGDQTSTGDDTTASDDNGNVTQRLSWLLNGKRSRRRTLVCRA